MLLLKVCGYGALAMGGLAIIFAAVDSFVPFIGTSAALVATGSALLGLDKVIEILGGIRTALTQDHQPSADSGQPEAPIRVMTIEELEAGIARLKAR